ncbi:MAG: hypothetical protein GC180_07440 [Bacteroidetes bacterium]|nr:hypothetical protein [Bacteroidota bacterium]
MLSAASDSMLVSKREMRIDSILQKAASYLGVGYCRGGVNRNCLDCSGFVQKVFAYYGEDLPHSSAGMAHRGKPVKKKENLQAGDLILFRGRNAKSKHVGHVGIVVQNDGNSIIFIHASVNNGICFEELETSSYYRVRFLGGRRIIPEEK